MIRLGVLAADGYLQEPSVRAQIPSGYEFVDYAQWQQWDRQILLRKCREVEVLLTARASPRLPDELADDFGSLRYACHFHGTIRHLISRHLIEKGLLVTNWGDEIAGVAEGAMALLLCQLKQLVTYNAASHGKPDQRIYQLYPPTLNGRDVGLYGFGPIGRHMAAMLQGFGAKIAIYDPYATDVPPSIRRCETLRELFSTCQIISIHCGLNDQTRDSVTRELLELLPQGGIVINTARGLIVDEQALADLVGAGKLLAGVDVIRDEGRWAESPLAPYPGAVLTRHGIGSGKGYPPGHQPPPRLPAHAVRNLEAYAAGRPLQYVITADAYDLKT